MFDVFDHTADIGLSIRGADVHELFAEAGRGLFSLITSDLQEVRPIEQTDYQIDGSQYDYLLFDWLTELLYTFESSQLLLCRFDVQVAESGLTAVCRGEQIDRARHRLEHEVKAITYHRLVVEQQAAGWLAEVIVDI